MLVDEHPEGEGALICARPFLMMMMMKGELPWLEVTFELKTQGFRLWCQKVLAVLGVSNRLNKTGLIAVVCARLYSLSKQHRDLVVIVSLWSFETHTLS